MTISASILFCTFCTGINPLYLFDGWCLGIVTGDSSLGVVSRFDVLSPTELEAILAGDKDLDFSRASSADAVAPLDMPKAPSRHYFDKRRLGRVDSACTYRQSLLYPNKGLPEPSIVERLFGEHKLHWGIPSLGHRHG